MRECHDVRSGPEADLVATYRATFALGHERTSWLELRIDVNGVTLAALAADRCQSVSADVIEKSSRTDLD